MTLAGAFYPVAQVEASRMLLGQATLSFGFLFKTWFVAVIGLSAVKDSLPSISIVLFRAKENM
jgi:hypothetical protein